MKTKETISMAHGNGGRLMHELISRLRRIFSNKILNEMADAAEFSISKKRLAFSTDSYVVKPLFFPGGDIGKLAVCGTVNDLAMKGARPLYISLAFIIEEGLEIALLEKIARSIQDTARKSGVFIVTGDLKVVERGAADQLFITTAGVGVIDHSGKPIGVKAKAGDAIIISGTIADHGMAIMCARENFGFTTKISSDCRNLNFDVEKCLRVSRRISVMRDPTRGGLATTLNEIAQSSNLGIEIFENNIPVKPAVKTMCDILGFDPLYVANEGKFICCVAELDAKKVCRALGKEAYIIGKVVSTHKAEVHLQTPLGSRRIIPMLEFDQLPRIC